MLLKAGRAYEASLPQSVHLSIPDEPVFATPAPRPNFQGVVQDLKTKAAALIKPGWFHLQTLSIANYDSENLGILDNGTPIPLHSITDEWFHISKEGLITESVTQMLTQGGEVVQVGVYQNGWVRNLTVGGDASPLAPYTPQFDNGFIATLRIAQERNDPIQLLHSQLDGQDVTLFLFPSEDLGLAAKYEYIDQPVLNTELRVYFNSVTGQFIKQETFFYLQDGTERLVYLFQPVIIAFDQPAPQFVLDYLTQPLGQEGSVLNPL